MRGIEKSQEGCRKHLMRPAASERKAGIGVGERET